MKPHDSFDAVVIGSGFASSFFLSEYLKHHGPNVRVLVIERGKRDSFSWQWQHQRNSSSNKRTFINRSPFKEWKANTGFGGGSNCWWACTPRMMPDDFQLHSKYGVGRDWPVSYNELEPYYTKAEQIMQVSGPDDISALYPRSSGFPQPPHRFSDPDRLLKKAYPGLFFNQPTGRSRKATPTRASCCASGVCHFCPIDAKFTIQNGMKDVYEDERVTLWMNSEVTHLEVEGGNRVSGVYLRNREGDKFVKGDLVVLGANAISNATLLHVSGLTHPQLGKNLSEQVSKYVLVDLDGVDCFNGSTSITGHGYNFYNTPDRSSRAGCLIETSNVPEIRAGRNRWQQRLRLKFIFEDFYVEGNELKFPDDPGQLPEAKYVSHSSLTAQGFKDLPKLVESFIAPLPVERYWVDKEVSPSEAHILGTTVMGNDPAGSVVDRGLVHHQARNLLVVGGGAFPTVNPANPTLTISALSLWAGDRLFQ